MLEADAKKDEASTLPPGEEDSSPREEDCFSKGRGPHIAAVLPGATTPAEEGNVPVAEDGLEDSPSRPTSCVKEVPAWRLQHAKESDHAGGAGLANCADAAAGLGRPCCGPLDMLKRPAETTEKSSDAIPSPSFLESDELAALRARAMAAVQMAKTAEQDSAAKASNDNRPQDFSTSAASSSRPPSQEATRHAAAEPPLQLQHSLSTNSSLSSFEMDVPDDTAVVSVHASKTVSFGTVESASKFGSSQPHSPSPKSTAEKEHAYVHPTLNRLAKRPESQILQLRHGAVRPTKVGFVGKGPFWTYDRSPEKPFSSKLQSSHSGDRSSGDKSATSSEVAAPRQHGSSVGGDSTFAITKFVGDCIDLLAGALNASADNAPPEEELTTVLLETKEQRLMWREFLSEAVSKSCASSMYSAFDVEAEPPRYARPPLSVADPAGVAEHLVDATAEVPVVAPNGAGWSPILDGPAERGPESPGAKPVTSPAEPVISSSPVGESGECCVCRPQAPASQLNLNLFDEGSAESRSAPVPPPAG